MTTQPLDLDAIKDRVHRATDGRQAALLSHAHEDVPALVAEVERLRAENAKTRRGAIHLGYLVNTLSLTMRCAWIAEQEKPGAGMAWIDNDLTEAGGIPGRAMDLEPADDWNGTETAQEYHDRTRADLRAENQQALAEVPGE